MVKYSLEHVINFFVILWQKEKKEITEISRESEEITSEIERNNEEWKNPNFDHNGNYDATHPVTN